MHERRYRARVGLLRFSVAFGVFLCWMQCGNAQDQFVAPTDPLTAEEQQQKFHLPAGFEIQLVAAEPEIRKPINLSFDHRGRLYATQSVEYPFPAKGDGPPRDCVKVFSSFGPNGRAREVQTFVDGLNIPIGVCTVPGGVLVYSIPNIYCCRDTDDDGRADTKELYYGTVGYGDTHGMINSFTRWIDGWIYGCHGYANTSQIKGSDNQPITMNSGNTYRLKMDGSHIEYYTHGQVNPFGMTFDPLGNIYTSDCHTKPLYMLLRGAYYPSFGKPHDGMGFGPEMCKHLHGSTGIAGVVFYAADHFPAKYRESLFIGNPVTGKVNRDTIRQSGSTYEAVEQPDFVTCDDPWFRPVDLQLGPDGALYIADFYNRIIGHYEVPLTHPGRDHDRGRIWRVVYTGEEETAEPLAPTPDVATAELGRLLEYLDHANLTVRTMATNELVDRFGRRAAEPVRQLLTGAGSQLQRAHGLWVVERTGGLDDELVVQLADDPAPIVRVHLIKALAERADWEGSGIEIAALVRGRLADDDAFVRRAAVEALALHPEAEDVRPLADLWTSTDSADTHLIHAARLALREQLRADGMYHVARQLAKENGDYFSQLADVSLGVHDDRSARFVFDFLNDAEGAEESLGAMLHHVARYLPSADLPNVYGWADRYRDKSPRDQSTVLHELYQAAQERNEPLPADVVTWAEQLASRLLSLDDRFQVRIGVELAREMHLVALHDEIMHVAGDSKSESLRAVAIDACVAVDANRSIPFLSSLLANVSEPITLRQRTAGALAGIGNDASRRVLLEQLVSAPENLAVEIASGLATRREGAMALLEMMEAGKASPRLLQERVVSERFRVLGMTPSHERIAALTANLPPADERILQLVNERRDGFLNGDHEAKLGIAVFEKTCAACHRIDGKGAKIGPDLDGIGLRGLDRLLEDVLDPSRNVDQAFRTTIVNTTAGQVITGLALREDGNVLVLADNQGKEIRIGLDEIDERSTSPLSPMPANVVDLVKASEFNHLMAYLLSQHESK